jgi:curli biogenesis system outer membrane secretion channel CsgG
MKKYLILLLLLSILFIPAHNIFAQEYKLPTLAVVSFENHSKVKVPDLENMGLQFLESTLSKSGMFTLLDRLTVQKSVEELGFNAASGLVDPSYAIQLGKMLGARYLTTGNVIDITHKVTKFQGYGVTTKKTAISVTIGLRIVDAERGTIFFIDQDVAAQELPLSTQNTNISGQTYSIYQNLMKQAILKSIDSLRQRVIATRPEVTKPPKIILVPIDSLPIGADVEVNGIFYGNTPLDLPLEEGKTLEITVSLGGYEPWIKKIFVNSNLKISCKLNKIVLPTDTSNVNVNVGVTTPEK